MELAASAAKRVSRGLTGGAPLAGTRASAVGSAADLSAGEAQGIATLDALLRPWEEEEGITDGDRAGREATAVKIRRAHLHQFRFATEAEEMAWLEEDQAAWLKARFGQRQVVLRSLADDGLDSPRKVWAKAAGKLPLLFSAHFFRLNDLGPNVLVDGRASRLPDGWQAPGNVVVTNVGTGLRALPDDLHVAGSLVLRDHSLSELPARLRVDGNLYVQDAAGLAALPSDMRVGGSLTALRCGLTALPYNLGEIVRGFITIQNCWRLASVPPLHVRGELDLALCSGVVDLPEALRVDGSLVLSSTRLTSLPWDDLHVRGDLMLARCRLLTSLPAQLRVDGKLDLTGCAGISVLPDELRVDGDVVLDRLNDLVALPAGFAPSKRLSLKGCSALAALPAGLRLTGLDATGCLSLSRLPGDMVVDGVAAFSDSSPSALPASVRLLGDVTLHRSTMSLPDDLRVEGDLSVQECGYEALPAGLVVEGGLSVWGCPNLTALPAALRASGSIRIGSTGVAALPWGERLHVRGNLELGSGLQRLPRDELRVDGRFELSGCPQVTSLPLVLDVGGALCVSDCNIDALPAGTKVGGHVELSRLPMLAALPEDLADFANKGLFLFDCPQVSALPPGLHLSRLDVSDCPLPGELPGDLVVEGDLRLRRTSVASLPATARFLGSIALAHCDLLQGLPSGLHVRGDLTVSACGSLTELPEGLQVDGRTFLWGLPNLEELPKDFVVGGFFVARECPLLREVPADARFGGHVSVYECVGLTSLPDDMHVRGEFTLSDCPGIVELPARLTVDEGFHMDGCSGITTLPACLEVHGDISARGPGLSELPDHWQVRGNLTLDECVDLAALPMGLTVGGDLDVASCVSLVELPDDDAFQVDGDFSLEGCTGVTALPDCVLAWGMCSNGQPHNIRLAGSGLPPEELARLQALDSPAMRFHVAMDESFGGVDFAADEFPTLDDAAKFWADEAGATAEADALAIAPFVEAAYVRGVLDFLSKLRRAKEFNNSLTKKGLASRVVQVLELLTGEDDGVREELVVRMADAVDTCSDKPMWALNQMSVLVHIAEARGDREALRVLGMGVMRLEVVHRHVRKAMDAMNFIDDVCVYLRFEIALRESLQLPVSALEMLYPSYVTVTDESISAAEAEALLLTEQDLEKWLPDWSEWQRQDRVEFAEGLDFSALKRNSTKRLSLSLRSLLGSKVADPVRVRPAKAVWSLADLMKHWINTGMDLNNTPRNVDYMRLNLTKCV